MARSVRSWKLSNVRKGDIEWVTKNLLSLALLCFGRRVKPLVLPAFAVVSTHRTVLGPCGKL
jgi:hypothetical protein